MLFFWLLAVAIPAAFGICVVVNCYVRERPKLISNSRWLWLNVRHTASDWHGLARDAREALKRKEPEPATGPRRVPGLARIGTAADAVGPSLAPSPAAFGAPQPRSTPPPLPPVGPAGPPAVLTLNGIPADHAAVHARIAAFEPENDAAMLDFLEGEARGAFGRGEAWFAHCETLAAATGLDPVFVQAVAAVAEAESDMAGLYAMLGRRLQETYALPYEHLDSGGSLPDDGNWLTSEGGA